MTTPPGAETTALLLARVRSGDAAARERLVARYLPLLKRWARGRLPAVARDLGDTDDLVQITLVRVLDHVGTFDASGGGSFLAYLRQALLNLLRNEIRRATRRGSATGLDDDLVDTQTLSPVEQAIGSERVRRYEAALAQLTPRTREAIVMRIEFGLDYGAIAAELGMSADAVRMAIKRGLADVAEAMRDDA